jgi:glycosyltransferase involved in cell wall biosynthesis
VNVAFVVHRYDAGEGTGGYVTHLLPRVARRHEVTLYAATVADDVPAGVSVVHVPAIRTRATPLILSFPPAFARVRRDHDLVHAQGWVTGSADVVTAHIVLAAWRDAARPVGALSLGERLLGWYVVRSEERLIRNARAVIVPSEAASRDIGRWYGRSTGVHVIPHGFTALPHVPAARADFGLPDEGFVALYVGDARKGLLPALEAVARSPAHLLVASHSKPDRYLGAAERLGMTARVHWAGPLAGIARAYLVSDVLVHPTIYDTFGLTAAEAMALGIPAIVSSRAGISELITHRENGWIADDVADTAAALEEMAADPDFRARLGAAARRTAERYTWDLVAERTLEVYDALGPR